MPLVVAKTDVASIKPKDSSNPITRASGELAIEGSRDELFFRHPVFRVDFCAWSSGHSLELIADLLLRVQQSCLAGGPDRRADGLDAFPVDEGASTRAAWLACLRRDLLHEEEALLGCDLIREGRDQLSIIHSRTHHGGDVTTNATSSQHFFLSFHARVCVRACIRACVCALARARNKVTLLY